MTLGSGPLRRHLIVLLMIALAVSVWPSLDLAKIDYAGLGNSQPWQSDQSANVNAVIETQAEIDQAEGSASDGGKIGLADVATSTLLAAPAQLIIPDGLPLYPKRRAHIPNKTGPPSA